MRLIQNGRVVSTLVTLARKHDIKCHADVTPEDLSRLMQEKWVQPGKHRFQITGEPPSEEDVTLLRELAFIDEMKPPLSIVKSADQETGSELDTPIEYKGLLSFGALRPRAVSRLHYLTNFHKALPQKTVYLLGGQRELEDEYKLKSTFKETRQILCTPAELPFKNEWVPPDTMPRTEAGMMMLIVEQSVLPQDWTYYVVDTAMQLKDPGNPDAGKRPPNTINTIQTLFNLDFRCKTQGKIWLYSKGEWELVNDLPPPLGTYLAASNQPYVTYQELVLQRFVPSGVTAYACGPDATLTLSLKMFLDNVAKQFYEELLAQK